FRGAIGGVGDAWTRNRRLTAIELGNIRSQVNHTNGPVDRLRANVSGSARQMGIDWKDLVGNLKMLGWGAAFTGLTMWLGHVIAEQEKAKRAAEDHRQALLDLAAT